MDKLTHKIASVAKGSIAEELELEPGDVILRINDKEIEDIFDYYYLTNDEYLVMLVEKADGEEWELEIEKDYDEELGITFENGLMDNYKSCSNKCIFCFIDQNPPGMRETIYFKDDDSRLSFLQGNYVTLTNMKEKDIKRIVEYNLDPINISVHTTNPDLRVEMLHNRFAGEALKKIDMLFEAGARMNGQIVLCKGVNDGDELRRTISDLMKYIPCMESVSVVPVGLSKYRDGLCQLEPFTKEDSKEVIEIIEGFRKECMEKYGTHFIHASDEWYIVAGLDIPTEDNYDGYIQLENGVGMTRLLMDEFYEALEERKADDKEREVSLVTGLLIKDLIFEFAKKVEEKFTKTKVNVYPIRNDFFGERITVTGLITGQDMINQLKDKSLGERLLLASNMVKSDEDVFLDDVSVAELSQKLNVKCVVLGPSGEDLLNGILGE